LTRAALLPLVVVLFVVSDPRKRGKMAGKVRTNKANYSGLLFGHLCVLDGATAVLKGARHKGLFKLMYRFLINLQKVCKQQELGEEEL